jgi:uncharacterized protein (DUF983 family)
MRTAAHEGHVAVSLQPRRQNPIFRHMQIDMIAQRPQRDVLRAMRQGFLGRCPKCGRGHLFRAFLKVADECDVCGEEMHHHQADDAPAYFVVLIVGHIVAALALETEVLFSPPYWVHMALWLPLTLILALGLLQPFKGAIVGLQWAQYMHGFDPRAASVSD